MSEFKYKAKKTDGQIITAHVSANSKEEAVEKICQFGYYPITVEDGSKSAVENKFSFSVLDGITMNRSVTFFSRQLATLVRSGVPLLRSVEIIREQNENRKFGQVLENIYINIRDGNRLSEVLDSHRALFDDFFISMVRVGEDNGTLAEVLLKIAEHRRKRSEIRSKIMGALLYPMMIALVGFFTVAYIMTNVLPKLVALIKNMGVTLPPATAALIGLVDFMKGRYILISSIAVILLFVVYKMNSGGKTRELLDGLKLKLPVFGKLILYSDLVNFTRTLKTSIESGVHMLMSIELASSVLANTIIKKELQKLYEDVKSGLPLGSRMKQSKLFPPFVSGMISVGEESGRLTGVLEEIGGDYEWRVNETIKNLMTLIEPVIIIVIGSVVGFIVIALLLPIFSMDILVK